MIQICVVYVSADIIALQKKIADVEQFLMIGYIAKFVCNPIEIHSFGMRKTKFSIRSVSSVVVKIFHVCSFNDAKLVIYCSITWYIDENNYKFAE